MSQATAIEWTEQTWGVVHGCSKVSTGCRSCYAETLSLRYGHTKLPWTARNAAENVILKPHKLREPLKRRKPTMYFVNSMSDLWHEQVPDGFIERVFAVMALTPQHTYQVLTKRPERMAQLLRNPGFHINVLNARWEMADVLGDSAVRARFLEANPGHPLARTCPWPLPNCWLGVSIENRKWVGRADLLREVPAAVRFVSAEPLLGPLVGNVLTDAECERAEAALPIDSPQTMPQGTESAGEWWDRLKRELAPNLDLTGISWLIIGGESGPGHRPMRLEWARDLVEATRCARCKGIGWLCAATGLPADGFCCGSSPGCPSSDGCPACERCGYTTACFVKQLGGPRPGTALEDLPPDLRLREFPACGAGA